jgi:hypothetical protein
MLYIGMLIFTLSLVGGSIAFVASGQHHKGPK